MRGIFKEVEREFARTILHRIEMYRRKVIRSIISAFIILISIIFLSISAIYFLIEYIHLTRTISFFIIGIILLIAGIVIKISR